MRSVTFNRADMYRGALILVNHRHPVMVNEIVNYLQLTSVDERHRDILLETRTAVLLSKLLYSIGCRDEIVPVSGYRSSDEQRKIYTGSLIENGSGFTEKYVALPGRSEHETGLAIDLGKSKDGIDFIRPEFPYTGIFADFRKEAARYGFIERYGKDKEAVTGIAHEPWHFRYVGYPHSQIMQNEGLCLEEYILFIKDFSYKGKHFLIKEQGKDIEVFYVGAHCDKTSVDLPANACFQVSGNNVDGFIVTVWRR
jgi:D-alanyl-D-alanine dipeptidase/carboxypeptidase